MGVVHDYERVSGAKLNTAKSGLCGLVGGETMAKKMRVSFSNGIVTVDNDSDKAKLDKLKSPSIFGALEKFHM